MATCYVYLRAEPGQSPEDLAALEKKLKAFYEEQLVPRGVAWGGSFIDDLSTARTEFEKRPAGGKLYWTLAPTEDEIEPRGDYLFVGSLTQLGADIFDMGATFDFLVREDECGIMIYDCERERSIGADNKRGRFLNQAITFACRWQRDFDAVAKQVPAPPAPQTPPSKKEKELLAEQDAVVCHLVQLRDSGLSWSKVVLRLSSDGFRNSNGKDWSMAAVKTAYRMAKIRQPPSLPSG